MAKQEERDWSEIMAEVRSKARSEVDEFVDDVKPRLKKLLDKVRSANFHDEAEGLLTKLKAIADDFSTHERGTRSPKEPEPKKRTPLYRDADGKEWYRAPKGWSDAQKKKFRIR